MTVLKFSFSDLSRGELELLTRIPHNGEINDFNEDYWRPLLKTSVSRKFKELEKRGLIRKATLVEKLKYVYRNSDLKNFLRSKGLKVSGNKDELVQRVVELSSSDNFVKNVEKRNIYKLTDLGSSFVDEYFKFLDNERNESEELSFECLMNNRLLEACNIIADFEKKQVTQRSLGLDWNNYDPTRDIERVRIILNDTPKILRNFPQNKLNEIRMGTAMQYLWGLDDGSKWIPKSFQEFSEMKTEVAMRMLMFYAIHKETLLYYNKYGINKVKILPAKDCCESCNNIGNREYTLKDLPELPYEKCTHPMGCRCALIPIVEY